MAGGFVEAGLRGVGRFADGLAGVRLVGVAVVARFGALRIFIPRALEAGFQQSCTQWTQRCGTGGGAQSGWHGAAGVDAGARRFAAKLAGQVAARCAQSFCGEHPARSNSGGAGFLCAPIIARAAVAAYGARQVARHQ